MSARMHYLNARQTLRRLIDVACRCRSSTRTTRRRPTRSPSATTTSSRPRSRSCSRRRLLVLLTDTAGPAHRRPRAATRAAELVAEVDDFAEPRRATRSASAPRAFGSGGMRSKVAAAEMASAAGIPVVICDGTATGTLAAAAAGETVGTRFAPHPERTPSFKLWLRYAKPSRGRLVVDAGAARVLREQRLEPAAGRGSSASRASSPPATRSRSSCGAGVVGKGISNYSSAELDRHQGPALGARPRADAQRRRGGGPPRPLRPDLGHTTPA